MQINYCQLFEDKVIHGLLEALHVHHVLHLEVKWLLDKFLHVTTHMIVLHNAIVKDKAVSRPFNWEIVSRLEFYVNVHWSALQPLVLPRAVNHDQGQVRDVVLFVQNRLGLFLVVHTLEVGVHFVEYCILIQSTANSGRVSLYGCCSDRSDWYWQFS